MLLACTLFGACQGGDTATPAADTAESAAVPDDKPDSTPEAAAGKKMKIGFSSFSLAAEFQTKLVEAMTNYVEREGLQDTVELVITDAQNDANKQNEQVENMISQGVECVMLCPLNKEAQAEAVKACHEAGIPVIEVNAQTDSDLTLSYVGSDDLDAGIKLMTELANQAGGKGNIVVLHGPAGLSAEILRHEGAQQVLQDYPDMNIVSEKICNWSREEAMTAMENVLSSELEVNVVFAENDEMAMGALMACEGNPKGEGIIIGGIDAISDALDAVAEDRLACTVFQNATAQAETGLEVAMEILNGNEIQPLYSIPFELVTKENTSDYIGR